MLNEKEIVSVHLHVPKTPENACGHQPTRSIFSPASSRGGARCAVHHYNRVAAYLLRLPGRATRAASLSSCLPRFDPIHN